MTKKNKTIRTKNMIDIQQKNILNFEISMSESDKIEINLLNNNKDVIKSKEIICNEPVSKYVYDLSLIDIKNENKSVYISYTKGSNVKVHNIWLS